MAETVVDQTLDTKGMNCPLPIIKARKALKGMSAGQILQVLSTDPGAVKDFEAFCRTTGNDLLESGQDDKVYTFLIRNNG
ncbi:MAG: sulfurtransferase TusA family protein [Proteobacteria bacterium]|nr:sulfurtransferase TusA family protein [Pseudomonadota bacterium]